MILRSNVQSANAISQLQTPFPTVLMAAAANGWDDIVRRLLPMMTKDNVIMFSNIKINYFLLNNTNALYLAARQKNPLVLKEILSSPKLSIETMNRITTDPEFPTVLMALCSQMGDWNSYINFILPKLSVENVCLKLETLDFQSQQPGERCDYDKRQSIIKLCFRRHCIQNNPKC